MSILPVAPLVGILPTEDLTVRWYGTSTIDAFGRAVDGAATEVTETLTVHPAPARMLEQLPEALRQRETLAVYARSPSLLIKPSGSRPAQLDRGGRTYHAAHVKDYSAQGGAYIVLMQLEDQTA